MADNKLVFEKINQEDLFSIKGDQLKLRNFTHILEVFKNRTIFKYFKSFPKREQMYLYSTCKGVYTEYNHNEIIVFVNQIFMESSIICPSIVTLESITRYIRYSLNASVGEPNPDPDHVVFKNGLLNLRTGSFKDWNPEIFTIHYLPFNYETNAECTNFFEFINRFTSYNKDRQLFLRAWMWAIIHGWTGGQAFLYLKGPGGTGKSTFATILIAIAGKESTVNTTLKDLSASPFETSFLANKKLILLSDVENHRGNFSIIKQISGGDPLRGRQKYSNNNFDVDIVGTMVLTGNNEISCRDAHNAMGRRLKVFLADNVISKDHRKELIVYDKNRGWLGEIAGELPGIYYWAFSFKPEEAKKYILDPSMVPSLEESNKETKENLNPLLTWIQDELEPGEGSYVGFKMKDDLKGYLETSRRKPLYPTYRLWVKKRDLYPLGHKKFSSDLLFALRESNFTAEKIKKTEGAYIKGVVVQDSVYNHDSMYGAPLQKQISPQEQTSPKVCTYTPPEGDKQHPALIPELYMKYMSKLENSPLKIELNKVSRRYCFDIKKLVKLYFEDIKDPSTSFIDRVTNVITKGTKTINSFGSIPISYKPMGTSPRILPISYGSTINNTKRIIREDVYSHLGKYLRTQDKIILDLDLVSCYTSILIGLYPGELEALQQAIETTGLWKYIYNEFVRNKKGHVYNKPAVKICTYSSFFLGGNKAMIEGILESFRKDIGLTQNEFKGCSDYEYFHTIARNVTGEMQNSAVITDFRHISNKIKDLYMDDFLIGPTGHRYKVTEVDFKSAYPNYLQSFEFALLGHTTLKLIEQFPEIELIGHFHDGNVIVIPKLMKEPIIEYFSMTLKEIGADLGLIYPQKLEVKKVYD